MPLEPLRPEGPRLLSGWDLPPLGAALLLVSLPRLLGPRLPRLVAVHRGLHGPDRWQTPDGAVGETLLIAGGIWIALLLVAWFGDRATPGSPALRPLVWMRAAVPGGVLLVGMGLLLAPVLGEGLPFLFTGLLLAAILAVVVTAIVHARRVTTHAEAPNPAHWRWCAFYVNPEDSRILVPKRNPALGWTLNFAHPASWGLLAAILALPLILLLLTR